MSRDWAPGDLAVVLASSLVGRLDCNEWQWTRGNQLGLVVAQSSLEPSLTAAVELALTDADEPRVHRYQVVFFAHVDHGLLITPSSWRNDVTTGFYNVRNDRLIDLSEVSNPARLFGRQRPPE